VNDITTRVERRFAEILKAENKGDNTKARKEI
jgi:hypothetical protein